MPIPLQGRITCYCAHSTFVLESRRDHPKNKPKRRVYTKERKLIHLLGLATSIPAITFYGHTLKTTDQQEQQQV